jgi:hypothetical protein
MWDDDDERTHALCIRCGQHFVARSTCPFCSDLGVSIQMEGEEEGDPWLFEVVGGDGTGVASAGGFPSYLDAQNAAHEFLRRYVGLRRRSATASSEPRR